MERKEKSGPAVWLLAAVAAVFLAALAAFLLSRFPAAGERFRVSTQHHTEESVPAEQNEIAAEESV